MALFRRRRRDEIDLESRSPQLGVKVKDLLVLQQLVNAGADVTQPRHVRHYLYFPDRERAANAAEEAAAHAFEASVREPLPECPDLWGLVFERHDVVLQLEMVRDTTDLFEALAASHGGDYDGWEASV